MRRSEKIRKRDGDEKDRKGGTRVLKRKMCEKEREETVIDNVAKERKSD